MIKKCLICGKEFYPTKQQIKKGKGKLCSLKCQHIWQKTKIKEKNSNWKGGKIKIICKVCKKEKFIKLSQSRIGENKFCSQKCSQIFRIKRIKRICKMCGKEFYSKISIIKKGAGKFCSSKCQYIFLSGKNNPNWKGGITPMTVQRLSLIKWKQIRKKILKRDNYICQKCGSKKNLHIHHIIPFRISKNNSLKNLITLCNKCHLRQEYLGQQYFNFLE